MIKTRKPDMKTGIWIDQGKAVIVSIKGDSEPVVEKLKSGVESRVRYAGESKITARFGKAFISDQEKKQHRQKNDREKYFKKIISLIQGSDYIYVFGPSDARHELINDIALDPVLKKKFIATEAADRMAEKQVVNHTLDYFNGELFRTEKRKLRKLLTPH